MATIAATHNAKGLPVNKTTATTIGVIIQLWAAIPNASQPNRFFSWPAHQLKKFFTIGFSFFQP
ncbi:MAG: hypothetical protein C4308_12060 [Chitinophagaceae bacterium]